jgi:1,4-dihydroxy-6-naphthoate synthase
VLTLGFSPCPNDCFIFYALAHARVAPELDVQVTLEDVEALNQRARTGALAVTKISYHAFFHLTDTYIMLRAGGALGYGVGPLVVTKRPQRSLKGLRVAIPGGLTTANLLLSLFEPEVDKVTLRYDRIMPAVATGAVDAGLIIHESRFTYPEYGLREYLDLGAWWEVETGLPLPLGGIMARRDLGEDVLTRVSGAVRESLRYAYAHPEETKPYVAAHAQELSERVRQQHIELYVNALSLDLGETGERAVRALQARAQTRGLAPAVREPLFWGS